MISLQDRLQDSTRILRIHSFYELTYEPYINSYAAITCRSEYRSLELNALFDSIRLFFHL